MISSKVFALSLLLVCPLALARVQLNADMEITNPSKQYYRGITTEVKLDANVPADAYKSDELHIKVQLLDEQENMVHVRYTVSAINAEGDFVIVAEPELCAVYGDTAKISLGNTNGDTFTMTLQAQKI